MPMCHGQLEMCRPFGSGLPELGVRTVGPSRSRREIPKTGMGLSNLDPTSSSTVLADVETNSARLDPDE